MSSVKRKVRLSHVLSMNSFYSECLFLQWFFTLCSPSPSTRLVLVLEGTTAWRAPVQGSQLAGSADSQMGAGLGGFWDAILGGNYNRQ